MTASEKYSVLVQMLERFIESEGEPRGTTFVREIEGEFARTGLDEEEEFSDLQHALAMYRGYEEDVRTLKHEASFAVRRLSARSARSRTRATLATSPFRPWQPYMKLRPQSRRASLIADDPENGGRGSHLY